MAELLRGLERLINGSSGIITIYPLGGAPLTTHHRLLANEDRELQIDKYASGAYLLDPFYRQAFDHQGAGVFTINDVAPAGFQESEYYHLFYQQLGFSDEICSLFQLEPQLEPDFEQGGIVSISLVRHSNEAPFTKDDIKQLEIVYPLLRVIVCQWLSNKVNSPGQNLEWQLDNALANFGTSILTPRECKILHLILHGCSIKLIAQKLDNSLETIKHHRKNIYSKLDVGSQAELFYLFITSLKVMPENSSVDPLTYMT